ncbi:mitochondrial ubiquitin ligase activator of nfkb 1-A-like [Erpetoichthys calabaricus]|uniref:mitochondrial ubiquitin ligase activator of nfkb 1-A-like n=1 Tax=Erpetoichthys calabaricus TaxID=27687 RepID=UPI002233F6E3|nr:mitochondrial ubiquitin ligase activator of nfkb 1-A-like [Erpetoichthys calabaricus]
MGDSMYSSMRLISIGGSFALSGLFYHLYTKKLGELQKLKEIPRVELNEDLIKTLDSSHQKCLQYVALEGIVKPDGESLASQFVPRCFGVIQRIIIQEYRRALNMITYIWDSKKQNRKEVIHTVPFSLVPVSGYDPGISVHVDSPLSASVLSLEPVYCYIRKAKMAFTDYFVLELNGQKPWWLEEKEEMLKVGSTLTGFGELILDSNRMLRLRPPQDGQKYLLIISDYRSYLQHQESSVTVWKVLTGVFGLLGVALLLLNIYRRCRRRRGNSIGKRHTIEETWRR